MNDDISQPADKMPPDESALEARIVAWVLGEASVFEAADLGRIVETRPELRLFKRRLEAVHGLLGEAEEIRRSNTLRLAPERRAKVLAALGGGPVPQADALGAESRPAAVMEPVLRSRVSPWKMWLVCGGGAVASLALIFLMIEVRTASVFSGSKGYHELRMESEDRQAAEPVFFMQMEEDHAVEPVPPAVADWATPTTRYRGLPPPPRTIGSARAAPLMKPATSRVEVLDFDAKKQVAEREAYEQTSFADGDSGHPNSILYGMGSASREVETYPLNENESIELAPFSIEATRESSYSESNTVAGTRLSTELKDMGSAVSIVTSEFLRDTGATSNDSLLLYTSSTETGGLQGNFAGTADTDSWSVGFATSELQSAGVEAAKADGASDDKPARPNPGEIAMGPNPAPALDHGDIPFALPETAAKAKGDAKAKEARDEEVRLLREASRLENRKVAERRQQAAPPAAASPSVQPKVGFKSEADAPRERGRGLAAVPESIDEAHAAKEPVSTFSLHVSDASFKLAQAALARGQAPDPMTIRPEEFYNAFDYGDPSPTQGEKVACRIEQAAHPFLQQRNLVRIAMKVASTGRGAGQPLRLTVLLDTSGSMEREDRVASVRRAIEALAALLGENDRVTLIGFSRQPRLLAEGIRGNEAGRLVDIVRSTPADGGTNMEEALKLAGELARRQFDAAAQNRIVLFTDGAANLGNADPKHLAAQIEDLRTRSIAFDACGVGTEGLDDEVLEALTRQGDGRYYIVNTAADADAGFARQLAGAFRPAAKNVKVQVRFNPARVGAYRLLGFEKHRLREEDFRNDSVDAAELAAEEAAVAVYQVEVLPQGEGELGDVFVRFRDTASGAMVERSWTMSHDSRARSFDQASSTLQLAGVAAMLAEKLRGGALADLIDLGQLSPIVNSVRGRYANTPRVQELAAMFETLRRMHGE